ncbi:hypothetical protein BDW59DRAFT_152905 [Aspergillus cavernicola]|uniref:Azaphilone pigments biosynthesis cluster protein L N-terminal domain-containing protein n=1 Tax=Aspergillus cavernicola TaxID=176166 RepID=A0ABR4HPA6_9EURO
MADPLSITVSVVAIITAAVQSTSSLRETVKRYKDRNKTLQRLQDELEDLVKILDSLTHVIDTETSVLALLEGPIGRCSQVCRDFEQSMNRFSGKSTTGFRDWRKMEFMRGDINEFIDTIAGYKSTISIGLGTITMHTSKVTHQVLQEYNEMIQDTVYSLEVHLQQIDEKMAQFTVENTNGSTINIDLKDEKEVTKQCLRICEDARSYIESLTTRESTLLQGSGQDTAENAVQTDFEAQLLTRQALDENRDNFSEITNRLRKRLESLIMNGTPGDDGERLQLQEDISISKQCLEVCKVAREISHQKIYRVGEAIAEGDSDQVVVNTLADLFDVNKARSSGNAAQLVGSMTPEALRHLAEQRYGRGRFGAFAGGRDPAEAKTTSSPSAFEQQKTERVFSPQPDNDGSPGPNSTRHTPFPNEVRKRGGNSTTH